MVWKPRVTVATIIEENGRYLLVEEEVGKPETAFNQPAGHLEDGESLVEACVRETLEETGYDFKPTALSGIYRWIEPNSGDTYLRACFTGELGAHHSNRELDPDITAIHWLGLGEIYELGPRLRSPLVLRCLEDHAQGCHYPLDLLKEL